MPIHLDKLVKRLKKFDWPGLRRLQKYVHSPYFGIYPPAVSLLEYMIPLHPGYAAKNVSVNKIARQHALLGAKRQQEAAATHLIKAIEQFLAQEHWQKTENEVSRHRLQGLKQIELTGDYEKQLAKEMTRLQSDTEQNFDVWYEKHLLTELSLNGFNAKLNRTTGNNIMPVIETLDVFHALKKLRYLCEAVNRKQFFGTQYHDEQIPVLLKILEPFTKPQYPYAYLFVNVFKMLVAEDFESSELYYRFIKQYALKQKGSPAQAMIEASTYATNQCLIWYNKGYTGAGNEYLWWIEWRMKHNLLLQGNKLLPITFRNLILVSYSCNNSDKIKQLINKYGKYLPMEYSETYLAFARAVQQYADKKYKEAIHLFMQAQAIEDPVFNSSIRRWQWMCTYDCDRNDVDTLLNQLQAFEKYLQRNSSELQYAIPVYKVFLGYGYKLLSSKPEDAETNLAALQQAEHFAGKDWLAEQFALKQKRTRTHSARVLVSRAG